MLLCLLVYLLAQRVIRINYRSLPLLVSCGNSVANTKFKRVSATTTPAITATTESLARRPDSSSQQWVNSSVHTKQEQDKSKPNVAVLSAKAMISSQTLNEANTGHFSGLGSGLGYGHVSITACMPDEFAEFAHVTSLLHQLLSSHGHKNNQQPQMQLPRHSTHIVGHAPTQLPTTTTKTATTTTAAATETTVHASEPRGASPRDIAILYRLNSTGRRLKPYLKQRCKGLQFRIKSGRVEGMRAHCIICLNFPCSMLFLFFNCCSLFVVRFCFCLYLLYDCI